MSVYLIPALISLVFKIYVLLFTIRGAKVSIVFLSLIIIFASHNAIELSGYIQFSMGSTDSPLFRPYYAATIFVLLYILLHGLAVSETGNKYITGVLVLIASTLSVLILFTDTVVAGYFPIGYTVTAIVGEYYWIFVAYVLIVLCANSFLLIYSYRRSASQLISIRCKYSLLALSPVMLVFFFVIIFKLTGIGISAVGLIPIATTLFLVIVIKTESKHKLSDVSRLMPLSPERVTASKFMDLLDSYVKNSNEVDIYKHLQDGVEKEIILYSLNKCNHNVTHTAQMMGLRNRSSLYSMMNRLGIDLRELKSSD